MMMRILATATGFFILTMLIPVSYVVAQDHGVPDSLILIPSELEAGGNDSIFTIEVWIFNDIDGVEVQYGFGWDSELSTLDSAKPSPMASSYDMMPIFYDRDIATSNLNNRAMYVSLDFIFSPIPPGPVRKHLATYYFSVSDWTRQSEIKIDTLSWDDGSEMLFVTEDEVYPPVWYGGDQPLIVRDVNADEDCCGMYTGGFTGNINCDPDGNRDLTDILMLVYRVFLTKTELCCEANGNVNGDVDGEIDLSDIFSLIDHVYLSKTETTACQ